MNPSLTQKFSKAYLEKKNNYYKNLNRLDDELKTFALTFEEAIESCLAELISIDLKKPVDVLPQRKYKVFLKFYIQGIEPAKVCLSVHLQLAEFSDARIFTSDELSISPPKDFIESKVVPSVDKALGKRGITFESNTVESINYPYVAYIDFE